MAKQTVAQQHIARFRGLTGIDGTQDLADELGATVDQDWENERTVVTFDDGSKLVMSGSEIVAVAQDHPGNN